MARKVPGALGRVWAGLAPTFSPGPSRESSKLGDIPMALLGPQDQCPKFGCPGQPTKDPQFTLVRHRFLCTPRKCQYSPCAEGAHTHTHTRAYTKCRCVLTCTPASPRDTALFPCCSRLVKPFHSWWIPWGPQPWQPCSQEPPGPWPQVSGTQRALTRSVLG